MCKYLQPAVANSFADTLEPYSTAVHTIAYFAAANKYYVYMTDHKVYETADITSAEATWTLRSSPGAGTVSPGGVKVVCKYDAADPKDVLVHFYTRLDGGQYYAELKWSTDGTNWTTITSNALGHASTGARDALYAAGEYNVVVYDSTASLTKFYRMTTKASVSSTFQYISMGFIYYDGVGVTYYYQTVNAGACVIWKWTGTAVSLVDTVTGGPVGECYKNMLFGGPDFSVTTGLIPPSSTDSYLLLSGEKTMRKSRNAWTGVAWNASPVAIDVALRPTKWADTTGGFTCSEVPLWVNLYYDVGPNTNWDRYTYRVYPGGGMLLVKYERVLNHARDPTVSHCGDSYLHEVVLSAVGAGESTQTIKQLAGTTIHGTLNLSRATPFAPRTGTLTTGDTISLSNGEGLILTSDAGVEVIHATTIRPTIRPGNYFTISLTGVEASDLNEQVFESQASTELAYIAATTAIARYCRFLSRVSITFDATTCAFSFAGTTVSGVLQWYCQFENLPCAIAADGGVTIGAAASGGIALTETSITSCVKTYRPTFARAIVRGPIVGGVTLLGIAASTTLLHGSDCSVGAAFMPNQTNLDTYAAAILTALEASAYTLALGGATTTCPSTGTTLTVQYNIAPISIAAPTAHTIEAWSWDESVATLTVTDAGMFYPAAQSAAYHAQETIANWVSNPSFGGDVTTSGTVFLTQDLVVPLMDKTAVNTTFIQLLTASTNFADFGCKIPRTWPTSGAVTIRVQYRWAGGNEANDRVMKIYSSSIADGEASSYNIYNNANWTFAAANDGVQKEATGTIASAAIQPGDRFWCEIYRNSVAGQTLRIDSVTLEIG